MPRQRDIIACDGLDQGQGKAKRISICGGLDDSVDVFKEERRPHDRVS
jgi:hypothetical protein